MAEHKRVSYNEFDFIGVQPVQRLEKNPLTPGDALLLTTTLGSVLLVATVQTEIGRTPLKQEPEEKAEALAGDAKKVAELFKQHDTQSTVEISKLDVFGSASKRTATLWVPLYKGQPVAISTEVDGVHLPARYSQGGLVEARLIVPDRN